MKFFLLTVLSCSSMVIFAQLFGPENIITGQADYARSVHAADLDQDGDMDVLSASSLEDKIAWYENDGFGNFSSELIISISADYANSVHAADLDQDGDMDVLSSSSNDDKIAWYENDGLGNFSSEVVISFNANGACSVFAADLDLDGDIDVISASRHDDKIAWYENDGLGNFSNEMEITSDADGAKSVYAADLDLDGDLDVLSASQFDDKIAWYENDGLGNFSNEVVISTDASAAMSVHATDLDLDGHIDVLSASKGDNKIAWYENDGFGNFSSELIISESALYAYSVYSADLDLDGDMDILMASYIDNEIAWYENDGLGGFSSEFSITTSAGGARSVYTADLDSDGDMDVLSASWLDNNISWYENLNGEGCTDEFACNYIEDAWIENGSCCYTNCGCTNILASNYSETAECEDFSCIYEISGVVFNDENGNGEFENFEFGLAFQTVTIEPQEIVIITNDTGEFSFEIEDEAATFFLEFNPIFPFNTTEHPVSFDPLTSEDVFIEFGISKEAPVFGICIDLYPSGNNFLCNNWSNHNICYRNMGNVPIDGIVELEYDPLFQDHAEITPIDSTNGNIVYMNFENLLPGEMFFYDVDLLTPTVDHIGEYITSFVRITGFYEDDQVAYGEQTLEMEITCAYDPNDKQAFPLGYTDEHWLLQQTEQEFLIRFQNTGNAPAQNIRIQDTLDVNFDIESFKLMANSHSVMTTIDPETRLIDFYFEDIQLPDSVNNEPDSHGLISYKITPLPDLPVGTVLENTAHIYFDNNEPIITNTTWTTIHECGGESEFSMETISGCESVELLFSSDYLPLESFIWQSNEETVSNDPEYALFLTEYSDYELTLTASNPLCQEATTSTFSINEGSLFFPCPGDYNCDAARNVSDLIAFLSDFGCSINCLKDLTGDGSINSDDLVAFLSFYGINCWE